MRLNGCHNREPLSANVVVPDGWLQDGRYTRKQKIKVIPDPMTKDCQYSKFDKYNDPQCAGCKWQHQKDST